MRAAVILTYNRPELLLRCVNAIATQVEYIVVVDNGSEPRVTPDILRPRVHKLIYDPRQPPNLAFLMNEGLDAVAEHAKHWSIERWDVAMLCDDVEAPFGWFDAVRDCVRLTGVAAGSTHSITPVVEPIIKLLPDNDIHNRMQGSAFVMVGERGLRADENMHWWWQDTDLDWQARLAGGMVIAPGPVAHNSQPNYYTNLRPDLAERAGVDGEYFAKKWGARPW